MIGKPGEKSSKPFRLTYKLYNLKFKKKWLPILLLLLADLCLLLFIYDDYGIGWDENSSRDIGVHNALVANQQLGYIFFEKTQLENRIKENLPDEKQQDYLNSEYISQYQYRMYGPVFELGLVSLETLMGIEDDRTLYLMRHIVTHLFFLFGLLIFYLLLFYHFEDWKISLLGTMMLLLVPRLFAHSFFNPKDIPFLVSAIIAAYTMVLLLDKPKFTRAIFHSLACAIAIDIRIIGVLFPLLTILLLFTESFIQQSRDKRDLSIILKTGLTFIFGTVLLTILFWPYTWENPIEHFLWSLKSMSDYPWQGSLVFLGNLYTPVEYLPSIFWPVWFVIMTPVLFLFGFLLALTRVPYFTKKYFSSTRKNSRLFLVALFFFIVPSGLPIFLGSVLYDDGRHLYFVYPFFIICVLYGFFWLQKKLEHWLQFKNNHFLWSLLILLIPLFLKMINLHPFQHIYFNILAGNHLEEKFEIDYWGVAYIKGLEYILEENNEEQLVSIMMDDSLLSPVVFNSFLLTSEELEQITWTYEIENADYFLTTYRCVPDRKKYLNEYGIDPQSEVKTIYAGGLKILSVFKLQKE